MRIPRLPPLALLLAACGCAIGPDYSRPSVDVPAAYKETGEWAVARPRDAVPKGKWWQVFNDPVLDELMEQVTISNQDLKAAEARYDQARAAVRSARSGFLPTFDLDSSATKTRATGRRYSVGVDARWEIDVWGRIRRLVEAANAGERASAADLEGARLSLQAELATTYFQLRVTDAQRDLLEDTVRAFTTSYNVTQNRYQAGVAGKADVVQAEAQLKSTEAQAIDLRITREQLEHAIAVLVGKAPAGFSLVPARFEMRIPDIPAGLPSTLLERRPDVAAAERRMAAANARIGVADAAYFPTLSLSGTAGYAGSTIAHLFSSPNLFWSIGAGLAGTILDFGARGAAVDTARGVYDESVADYRGTVLGAFQEVENALSAVHWLAEESKVQQDAARAARESVVLTVNQYKAGTASFLNVVQVQATQLSEERNTVTLVGRRAAAAISLVKAIGGTWEPPATDPESSPPR